MTKNCTKATTLLEAVLNGLRDAGRHQTGVEEAPAAILWSDPSGEWGPVVQLLREQVQHLLTLGSYDLGHKTGPAIWIKCVIAGALPDVVLPKGPTPIIYLPGVSRQQLRAGDECPRELQPLVELQYRGTVWTQRSGRDWTVEAMLTSEDGLGLDVARDARTRQSLEASLRTLATTSTVQFMDKRLEAEDFDKLMVGDQPRDLLMWMSDPETSARRMKDEGRWHAFRNRCREEYEFDPESDGELVAGERLGVHSTPVWETLWRRFCESPSLYPGLPDLLSRSKPSSLAFDREPWPDVNDEAESDLRAALIDLGKLAETAARARIAELEKEHGLRRAWVWAKLGRSSLAVALEQLARLAIATTNRIGGDLPDEMARLYAEGGFIADDAAIRALAAVKVNGDLHAVTAAIRAIYLPWSDDAARRLQDLIAKKPLPGPGGQPVVEGDVGCCLLFADGLRFDLGQRLGTVLEARGLRVTQLRRWSALPSVTATAKPAVSPAARRVKGAGLPDTFKPNNDAGQLLETPRLRKMIEEEGYQYIEAGGTGRAGEPDARGWTEFGQIDRRGHDLEAQLARHLADELDRLVERIVELLDSGWTSVRVVTDHGWLLMPGGLPRHELPSYLTECKWARCATIKGQSKVAVPTVHWHWNEQADFAVAPGVTCFSAGHEYAHGGVSLQECLIPDLVIHPEKGPQAPAPTITDVQWLGLRCRITVAPAGTGLQADIRTKPNSADTSITTSPKPIGPDGRVGLIVANEDLNGSAAIVVVLDAPGRPIAKQPTTVGGDE